MAKSLLATEWKRFWHQPVRAERLALVRILLALALLDQPADPVCCPTWSEFYGPTGSLPGVCTMPIG